jgi:hypothetical protein
VFFDKYAKIAIEKLKQWLYDGLDTGVAATVGRDRSPELLDRSGGGTRVCDAFFDLDGVVCMGMRLRGGFHVDVQTRPVGNELRRNAGYFGRILEQDKVDYLVQVLVTLTPLPANFLRRLPGFPNAFEIRCWEAHLAPAEELFAMDCPEAALLAMLSTRMERNQIIARLVQTLNRIERRDERRFWFEGFMGFAELRSDRRVFKMEMVKQIEKDALENERLRELEIVYGTFIEEGFEKGFEQGEKSGFDKGEHSGLIKAVRMMKEMGMDWRTFAVNAGIRPEELGE